jgi:hypothetical protein
MMTPSTVRMLGTNTPWKVPNLYPLVLLDMDGRALAPVPSS